MFEITTDGKVYLDGKEKRQSTHSAGYKVVSCKGKLYYVHRLVAEQHIPNPHEYKQVNHINGIKDDNRVENLEWVSPIMNMRHAMDTKLWGKNIIEKRKFTDNQVIEIRELFSTGQRTISSLADEYSVNYRTIYDMVKYKHYNKKIEDYKNVSM